MTKGRHAAVGFGNPSQHSIIFSTIWNVTYPVSRSTTLVLLPCFSGAKWDLEALPLIAARNVLALQLPENVDSVDEYADFIGNQVADLDDFVLVGDSFGAVIGLVLALRRPRGLRGLVMSGGFAANPLPAWKGLAARASRFAGGPLYRQGTLRFHAFQLSSRFDKQAEIPHSQRNYQDLFVENTPRSSYTARVTSVIDFDVLNQLDKVKVPTLLITPDDDRLVGAQASRDLLEGIHDSEEVVLPSTGHMFRFTHPTLYSRTVLDFVDRLAAPPVIR